METIVKYRFDKEMVSFVKKLDIKTAMFGYDKSDVYSKFKDLLIKARDVCEELVAEEYRSVNQMKAEMIKAAGDPANLQKLLEKWKDEGSLDGTDVLSYAEGKALVNADVSESDNLIDAIVSSALPEDDNLIDTIVPSAGTEVETHPQAEEIAPDAVVLSGVVAEMESQIGELQAELAYYKDREEELNRTADILREARLEGESIVQSAKLRAEQELFLYRAKRRDEEEAFQEVLKDLEVQKADLEKACALYRDYIDEGRGLLNQLKDYATKFSPFSSRDRDSLPSGNAFADET